MQNSGVKEKAGAFVDMNEIPFEYRYRTLSVSHLAELQEEIARLDREGRLNNHPVFRSYINPFHFELPQNFSEARSVIVMAIFIPPMTVNLRVDGKSIPAFMPPNYYEPGLTGKGIKEAIQSQIIVQPGYRVERTNTFHMKLTAVRSGLARYGRNNIAYVDGMGSFFTLHVYLTDFVFAEDDWGELQMLDSCADCRICEKLCPGGAIRRDDFVINIQRCISLYNEIGGVLPDWIPAGAHNAIYGCMKCQAPCPANREAMQRLGQFEDLTEEETCQMLSGSPDEPTIISVGDKLKIPYLKDDSDSVAVVSRNMNALVHSVLP